MTEATISKLKNHLPELVHKAEEGEDIQITRHGKPVAVIVSQERYNRMVTNAPNLATTFKRWRAMHPDVEGFTDEEIRQMHERTRERFSESLENVWD